MGLLGVAAGREPGGAGDAESPVWALVVAAGAGGQEGGLCGPTVSAPSVGLAGLERSPSCSFSLFPLLPQPTPPNLTPTYPGLSRAAGGGVICRYGGGRGSFLNLLWASLGPW